MIVYWDASALVLLYLDLQGKDSAERTFREADLNLVSKLTVLEAYRAFAALAAQRKISVQDARNAAGKLRKDQGLLNARSVDATLQGRALEKYLQLLERHSVLGTNDVVHLTTAVIWRNELRQPITVLTRDLQLAAAARRERLRVTVPSAGPR